VFVINRMLQISFIFLVPILLSGCATIFNNKSQVVTFTSQPSGATVYIDNIPAGKTPVYVALKIFSHHNDKLPKITLEDGSQLNPNIGEHLVTYKLDGYENSIIIIKPQKYTKSAGNKNYALCVFDATVSSVFLPASFTAPVDSSLGACGSFEKSYHVNLTEYEGLNNITEDNQQSFFNGTFSAPSLGGSIK